MSNQATVSNKVKPDRQSLPGGRPVSPADYLAGYLNLDTAAIAKVAFDALPEIVKREYLDIDNIKVTLEYLKTRWNDYRQGLVLSPGEVFEHWLNEVSPGLMKRQQEWVASQAPSVETKFKAQRLVEEGQQMSYERAFDLLNGLTEDNFNVLLAEPSERAEKIRREKWTKTKCLEIVRGCICFTNNQIVGSVKRGEAGGTWYVVRQDGTEIRFGTIREIRKLDKVKDAVADATGEIYKVFRVRQSKWEQVVQAIMDMAEHVETDSDKDETDVWVRSYLRDRHLKQVDNCETLFDVLNDDQGDAVFIKDGCPHISLVKFRTYVRAIYGTPLSIQELGQRLSAHVGAKNIPVTGKSRGQSLSAKVWRIPTQYKPILRHNGSVVEFAGQVPV